MEPLLNAIRLCSLAIVILVLISLRRAHIRVEYSMSWLGAAVTLLILSLWRHLLERVGAWLGLGSDPASVLVLLIVFVLFVVSYRSSVILSHLKDSNIALAHKVAMLEFRISVIDEKQQDKDHS